jgi:hypothetical protein
VVVDGNVEILAVAFWKRKGSRDGQNMIPFAERQNADIAQLVEQVIRNDQVVGSNPTIGSSLRSRRGIRNLISQVNCLKLGVKS